MSLSPPIISRASKPAYSFEPYQDQLDNQPYQDQLDNQPYQDKLDNDQTHGWYDHRFEGEQHQVTAEYVGDYPVHHQSGQAHDVHHPQTDLHQQHINHPSASIPYVPYDSEAYLLPEPQVYSPPSPVYLLPT